MDKICYDSGTRWESIVGYSRVVRFGRHVHVSGTTATDEKGEIVGKGSAFEQTQKVLVNIEGALEHVGASITDVVRTRIYVVNIEDWKEIGRAHSHVFDQIRPATAMVEVSRLIDPEILVEIEADAFVTESSY